MKNKSKYFVLAKAMYKNRCDWSNGFQFVQEALKSFSVGNKLDEEITKELYSTTQEKEIWNRMEG